MVVPAREALAVGLADTVVAVETFISEDPEGGRRGQAVVAAIFDLVFEDVRMGRINDPSRRHPGDVLVFDGSVLAVAVEVRQKVVSVDDALAFAKLAADAHVGTAVVAALHPSQEKLHGSTLLTIAEEKHGVLLWVVASVEELVVSALTWSGKPVDNRLLSLQECVAARLQEIEVPASTLRRWRELLQAVASGDAAQDEHLF